MDGIISPAVITSKVARDDFNKIQSDHSSLLKSMALQSQKVDMHNTNKATELAAQNSMKMEMDKAKMTASTDAQREANDFAIRQAEIDVKRAGLNA